MTEKKLKHISKEDINYLPLKSYQGPVTIINSDKQIPKVLKILFKEKYLGFDTETKPSFKKGQAFFPSLLQLAGKSKVYLFQISLLHDLEQLFSILSEPTIIKAGVAISRDLKELQELYSFEPGGFIELSTMADRCNIANNGLRGITAACLGFRISKSAQCSDWSSKNLSDKQIVYAATDAWVSREIYLKLLTLEK